MSNLPFNVWISAISSFKYSTQGWVFSLFAFSSIFSDKSTPRTYSAPSLANSTVFFQYLHLVDLSGAKSGGTDGKELISAIARSVGMKTEVGGGIRSMETIKSYLENGVDRVILGTAAINNKALLKEAVAAYGDRIIVGIDARNGKVSVSGWTSDSDIDYIDLARECESIGVKNIIFTDISRDGSLKGPNLDMLKRLSDSVSCDITASGGIKSIDDIIALRKMNLYGAICGKSLYSGTLSLTEALEKAR